MTRVLFVCIHNSARSQIAEAWFNHITDDTCKAESAGIEPGTLNPLVVQAMAEIGIDISGKTTNSADAFLREGKTYSCVVTVCNREAAEKCPTFPGLERQEHWSFPDPSGVTGTQAEKLAQVREIRDAICRKIDEWVAELRA